MYPDQTWQEGVMVCIYDADFGNMCRKTLENDLGSRSGQLLGDEQQYHEKLFRSNMAVRCNDWSKILAMCALL